MTDSLSVTAFQGLIRELLPSGHPTIDRAARRYGIPVRTLQRRLHEVGFTYSELVDAVRFEAARRLLDDPQARIAEVAAAVGFADPSNLSRAFVRWTGAPPREYRRRRAGAQPKPPRKVKKRSGVK